MLMEGDYPVDFGRYSLLGVLGEGAMARVYRAELRGPDGFTKPTAIKTEITLPHQRGDACQMNRHAIRARQMGITASLIQL